MANGFAAGGQRTATTDVKNFSSFPTRILGPELMDEFREQSLRFGTGIITETISEIDHPTVRSDTGVKVRRVRSPRRLTRSSPLPVLARKRLGLKSEEAY
ncbi:hypothetical protein K435DRAFT_774950 [Dendrothele bispora CBS 962.96]|uniref:Uncharacterized protein n=1 Tax=Dendrothele bispora (strain CBS 962.96) TaxID=1314807 RepID=A0A4S8MKP4_DENBC|nr:hypothetical protein K435DRAFT_774950 [Dendrothele bispora CBS 962.96]